MKTRLHLFAALLCLLTPALALAQAARQPERVAASFLLARGRAATPAELEQWKQGGDLPITDLLKRHGEQLAGDAKARQAVLAKAAVDSTGEPAGEAKAAQGNDSGAVYFHQVAKHVDALSKDASRYEAVIKRAYNDVLQRAPFPEEITYWKNKGTVPYVLMIAGIDNWGRRNAPGLMVTTGEAAISHNSELLSTVRLSPGIAEEARAAVGLPVQGERSVAYIKGRNVIYPGAAEVVAVGGTHFVAAGAETFLFGRR